MLPAFPLPASGARALRGAVRRGDALHASLHHVRPGLVERTLGVDAAAGVLDHIGLEAAVARVDRRPGDAEVGGETGDEYLFDAALGEVAAEPGWGLVVGVEEPRIAVHVLVIALADDELGVGNGMSLEMSAPEVPCTQW